MTVLVPVFLYFLSCLPVSVRTADCDPLGYAVIVTRINSSLDTGAEGSADGVLSISYNCFAHGMNPKKLRSFVVTVDTKRQSHNSTYRFICDTNGLYKPPELLSTTRPPSENVSFNFHCSNCTNSHPVCQCKYITW
jgi:hypothetical protein